MHSNSNLFATILMTIAASPLPAAEPAPSSPAALFDNVAAILRDRYYDRQFRETQLPALIEKYRPAPGSPSELKAQRTAAEKLLARVPASHLGLLSEESFHYLVAELSGQDRPTFGFQLVRIAGDYFTFFVLEGGPAVAAGIQPWERVVSIDGLSVTASPRLDWAQKDAYLPVDRDPPIHSILGRTGDEIAVLLERARGEPRTIKIKAHNYSALRAARASARTLRSAVARPAMSIFGLSIRPA
jgi:C-terminal processing protease CtpA/Prc